MAPPYVAPSRNPRLRDPACAPAPMMAKLMGIIGSTHGVKLSARPPTSTMTKIAAAPRPSNQPLSVTPVSALRMNFRKSSVARYPAPTVGVVNRSSAGEGWFDGLGTAAGVATADDEGGTTGESAVPKRIAL